MSTVPRCAPVSHSGRTLPRHIWFLIRLIMSNNVCGSAHPSGAPFLSSDITHGHECLVEGKKRLLYRMALRPRTDLREHVAYIRLNIDTNANKTQSTNDRHDKISLIVSKNINLHSRHFSFFLYCCQIDTFILQ